MKSLKKSYMLLFGAALSMNLLSGCQGESGDVSTPEHSTDAVTYAAQDTVRQIMLDDHYYVDLQENMSASNGQKAYLKSVLPLTDAPECRVLTTTSTGFTVLADAAKACFYSYTVSGENKTAKVLSRSMVNEDGSGTATVSVIAGSKTELLPPVSAVTVEDTAVDVNPISELGTTTYGELDLRSFYVDSVAIISTDTSSGSTVSTDTTSITYTPGPGVTGFERVLYSLTDGTNVLLGTVDVAVSTEANKVPEADDFVYQPKDSTVVPYSQDEEIDVIKHIRDADGDPLQLVELHAFNMTMPLNDEPNNTKFTFNSNEPGLHYITYVVTDHRGGYATGVIRLRVSEVYGMVFVQIGPEPNDGDDLYFAPPYTANQAEDAGIKSVPGPEGDGSIALKGVRTATHDWVTAEGLCQAKGGSLPSTDQLAELYKQNPSGALFSGEDVKTKVKYQWPLDLSYWSSTEGSSGAVEGKYQTVNLANGEVTDDVKSHEKHYVACLSGKAIAVEVKGPDRVNVTPGQMKPPATAEYSLMGISADGSEEDIYSGDVEWHMTASDPYFAMSGTVTVHNDEGTFDYIPENNKEQKEGEITVEGCDKYHTCNTKVTSLIVCKDLGDGCIDIYDVPIPNADGKYDLDKDGNITNPLSGKLYTSSPSSTYLASIGIEWNDPSKWDNEEHVATDGTLAPVGKSFPQFGISFAKDELCSHYRDMKLGGRDNWRMPERKNGAENEIKNDLVDPLYATDADLNMFKLRGWPIDKAPWSVHYLSKDIVGVTSLVDGVFHEKNKTHLGYISCVSDKS